MDIHSQIAAARANTRTLAILCAALLLLLTWPAAAQSCSTEVYENTALSWVHEGHCPSYEAAFAACSDLAVARGYDPRVSCAPLKAEARGGVVSGGWFRYQQHGQKAPFALARFSYGGDPEPLPRDTLGEPTCPEACVGDPINAMVGNKFETKLEYSVPGSRLEVAWTYNSQFKPH